MEALKGKKNPSEAFDHLTIFSEQEWKTVDIGVGVELYMHKKEARFGT